MITAATDQVGVLRSDGTPILWNDKSIALKTKVLDFALQYYDQFCQVNTDGHILYGYWDLYENIHLSDSGVSNAIAVRAGDGGYVALHDDGTAVIIGSTNNPPFSNIVSVASAAGGLLALRSDGIVLSWNDPFPVPVGLSNVVAIVADGVRMALRRDGTVVAWGDNVRTNLPPGLSNVVAVACGDQALALRQDGTVVGWGGGPGTQVPAALSNVVAIAASSSQSAVIVDPSPPPLLISSAGITNGLFQATATTISGRVYCLEYAASLPATHWTPLPLVAGNGRIRVLTDPTPVAATTGQRFYRVRKW